MPSPVKPCRPPTKRRGATLVMVAFMILPLMGVLAIAVDIGKFYVVTAELQTAADAAAIRGARKLQMTPGTSPETVVDAAVVAWMPTANNADNTTLSVTASDVQMGFWTPGDTSANLILAGRRPNAVVVDVRASPKGFFSKAIGQVLGVPMKRQATAWIANLGANCVRPWAFPYLPLYKVVSGNSAATDIAPDLDPSKFVIYVEKDSTQHYFTFVGQNGITATTPVNDGEWTGFNFTGNAGKPGFVDGIEGCRQYPVNTDASFGTTLPGQASQYATWAAQAIEKSPANPDAVCYMKANDAGCYQTATSTTPGVTINSTWGNVVSTGSNSIDFRYVGEFVLTCFYRQASDVCSSPKPGSPNTGYPKGTVVGFMQTLKSRIITPDDVVGNSPSNVQRIILVK